LIIPAKRIKFRKNTFKDSGVMKILLIEDDKRTAAFIVKGLKQAGYAVEHSSDGVDGLFRAAEEEFDLAIIDIMLPRLDGLTVIDELRKKEITIPIIILSAKSSVDDRIKGLQKGGDDYLVKPFAFSELLARIQALLRRANAVAEPASLTVGDLKIDILTRKVYRGDARIDIQPLEYALLEYLVRNKGRVVSKTMIMEHVWEYNFDPQTNVVEARICRLRDKIDRPFKTKLIHTVRGFGYVIEEEKKHF
jgi:DNA-binding response OmpR family regulator